MAERTVSPAVFTNEIDSSFLIQGIGDIGGAVIGPFTKGPAYSPTIIRDVNQLEALFGTPQGIYYQPFTAREYLLNQGVVTIVRTGALEGWMCENALLVRANYVSGSITSDTVAEGDLVAGTFKNEEEGIENTTTLPLEKLKGKANLKKFVGAKVGDPISLKQKVFLKMIMT